MAHPFGSFIGILVSFYCDFCPHTMLLQTGHPKQGFKDHVSTILNILKHTHFTLFTQPKKKYYIASLDCNTCLLIKECGIKRTFKGKRGGKYRPQSLDQTEESTIHCSNHYLYIALLIGKEKKHKFLADKQTFFAANIRC